MRALLFAAAVALLPVSAAEAQDAGHNALPSATPSSTLVEQLKAAGELKDPNVRVLEAPAPKLEPEARPVGPAAPATAPTAPAPASTATRPAETKAAESKPAEAATANRPAKKRVARRHETNEQKARRIAARYGIHW